MFRKFTITSRFIFLIVFMVLFALGIAGAFTLYMKSVGETSVLKAEKVMEAGYQRTLRFSVESIGSMLADVVRKAEAEGKDPKPAMRDAIQNIRYDQKGYFFVNDITGRIVANPLIPEWNGKMDLEKKDAKGNFFTKAFIEQAKKGGGFVTYWFPKPGEKEPSPKLSYVDRIGDTPYYVVSGVYIDGIQAEKAEIDDTLKGILNSALVTVGSATGAILLLIVLPLVIAIVKSILGPLKQATADAQEVAKGNLDVHVNVQGRDEITHLENALDQMITTLVDNLHEIEAKSEAAEQKARDAEIATAEAEEARQQAERAKSEGMHAAAERLEAVVARVATASEEISAQSDEIRNGAELQSARISETATAMEEMNATVLEVAKNSSEAAEAGSDAKAKAQNGAEIVHQSIEAMNVTQQQIMQLKENMGHLGQQAEAIGNIMNVIEDIADQTNLLALNAAIEAARAGEAGRGFAVVADEVRKLAEKTMGATKEVGDSIRAIQDGARENIKSVDLAVQDMDKVVELTNESGQVLGEIVAGVEASADQIQGIATAAEEQSATSEEINSSIDEVNRITDETAQGVAQTAEAVQELSSQMIELSELVQELKNA